MSNSSSSSKSISVVSVKDRYLYQEDGTRFFMKGIAFPVPPLLVDYNETAWIAILHQLHDNDLRINTIRIYRMDPYTNYTGFFHAAAKLGIYILVPLTSIEGDGDLSRDKAAPHCYSKKLLEYGVACLRNFLQFDNTLAGVVGNEVMNDFKTWLAAPCIKAYVRDLKRHMNGRKLPLLYTAQDDAGMGAAVTNVQAMQLTLKYLTCSTNNQVDDASIDILGINVESWCSATGTFQSNDDGSTGSYYLLWNGLHNSSIPLVFAEMGCPHSLFNRDNNISDKTRDWSQVSIVLNDMADTWSGFCAYTYDGSPNFNMMKGGPWNGHDELKPTSDFFNFRNQLLSVDTNRTTKNHSVLTPRSPPTCASVLAEMRSCCEGVFVEHKINLYNVDRIPSYAKGALPGPPFWIAVLLLIVVTVIAAVVKRFRRKRSAPTSDIENVSVNVKYQSIN